MNFVFQSIVWNLLNFVPLHLKGPKKKDPVEQKYELDLVDVIGAVVATFFLILVMIVFLYARWEHRIYIFQIILVITALFSKLSWPGDSEETFRSSSQASTFLPSYHGGAKL